MRGGLRVFQVLTAGWTAVSSGESQVDEVGSGGGWRSVVIVVEMAETMSVLGKLVQRRVILGGG